MTLTATYWLCYGCFEVLPKDTNKFDFEMIEENFNKILALVNQEESQDRLQKKNYIIVRNMYCDLT